MAAMFCFVWPPSLPLADSLAGKGRGRILKCTLQWLPPLMRLIPHCSSEIRISGSSCCSDISSWFRTLSLLSFISATDKQNKTKPKIVSRKLLISVQNLSVTFHRTKITQRFWRSSLMGDEIFMCVQKLLKLTSICSMAKQPLLFLIHPHHCYYIGNITYLHIYIKFLIINIYIF